MGRITIPKVEGISSRQAHADLPSGTYERELGQQGFFGPSTQMYHQHAPTDWTSIEGPLKPRAFDSNKLDIKTNEPWSTLPLLSNQHISIRRWNIDKSMTALVRNSDGDELLFIHDGAAELYCDYGHMSIVEGDYIMLPRGTAWRLVVTEPLSILMIEATDGHYGLPDKGLLGEHAIFDPAMLDSPAINDQFEQQKNEPINDIVVKRHGLLTAIHYPFNPLDAIGWHGSLMPVKINWRDIRPIMSHRYHVPPSAHTTFLTDQFIVCTFCPRPIETDPGALKVPFFHNNDDYDEVIFYHRGEFFSRDNIQPGMLTLHPSGLTHGPHPKAFDTGAKASRKETDEVAVMIDSRVALQVTDSAKNIEWTGYVDSWKSNGKKDVTKKGKI